MRTFDRLRAYRRPVATAALVAAIAAIGAIDVVTGPDIGFSVFYLIPVATAAWRLGRGPGVLVACAAATTWLASDRLTASYDPAISVWNGVTRFGIFNGVAILIDLAHRKEERIRASMRELDAERSRQAALVEALRDPIVVVGRDGLIWSSNEPALDLLGPAPLVGRRIEDVMPFVKDRLRGRKRWPGTLTDPFGGRVEVEVSRTRVSGPEGDRAAMYVIHDITHHAELNRMREQLLYSVAHELRGPLGVLENALELIATEYADMSAEEFGRLTGSAQRTASRLRTLMEDLLSAGSIQSGRFVIVKAPVRLREIVDEARETVDLMLGQREQRIDVELAEDDLTVNADRRYARQVLSNLLANASKYGAEGAPITVRARPDEDRIRVEVSDRGLGIPKEELAGLFERFYRMRRTADEPGIGLGLAIAKGIVEAHGGDMGIDSELGKGTTVWFTLPAVRDALAAAR